MSSPIAFAIRPRLLTTTTARIAPLSNRTTSAVAISAKLRSPVLTATRGGMVSSPSLSLLLSRSIATTAFRAASAQSTEKVLEKPVAVQETAPKSRIVQLFEKSKELITFYKTGLKTLWANQKEAKALTTRVQEQGYVLNRSEFQLVHTSKKDMLKLIPFGIIFLVLPESIPLWVMFAPGIIPSTCVQESQVLKQRKKLDDARQVMTKNVLAAATVIPGLSAEDFLTLRDFAKIAKNYNYDFELKQIRKGNLSAYCRFMGLPSWGTKSILERRLNSHMDYLLKDDQLLAKEGIDKLTHAQLQQAVEERGMRSLDVDEEQLRRRLDYWIKINLNEQPIARGLLVFSRMFLLNANYK